MALNKKTDILEEISPNLEKVNKKIKKRLDRFFTPEGILKEDYAEKVSCYNCGSEDISSEFYVDRFRHVRCKKCGMVYVNPCFKSSIIESTYSEDEYSDFQYKTKIIPAVKFRKDILGIRKYEQINNFFKDKGKILDIGCGIGEVLSVFKDKGWDTQGIELNDLAAQYARNNFGLDVVQDSVYNFSFKDKYDCIMMWGIVEHFTEPKKLLKQVKKMLAPKGLLVIEVPSADSFLVKFIEARGNANKLSPKRILIPDRHLMFFSHISLREMLVSSGFVIEKCLTNGLDISTLFRILSIEANDQSNVLDMQSVVDKSGCGDLIRVFCRHKEEI
jgi:2-polyprenyl-3-methyl-5-hydroxy-6-metoxy-1,4-benzoquinol methylase